MTLQVDFSMEDERGQVPALLDRLPVASWPHPGDYVSADDGEGTRCSAKVVEVWQERQLAWLETVPGTAKRNMEAPAVNAT